MRTLRNLAAHEYGTDYNETAEHFNMLHDLSGRLYQISGLFSDYCRDTLGLEPENSVQDSLLQTTEYILTQD